MCGFHLLNHWTSFWSFCPHLRHREAKETITKHKCTISQPASVGLAPACPSHTCTRTHTHVQVAATCMCMQLHVQCMYTCTCAYMYGHFKFMYSSSCDTLHKIVESSPGDTPAFNMKHQKAGCGGYIYMYMYVSPEGVH